MRVAVNSLKTQGFFAALVLVAAVFCAGCGSLARTATRPMIESLSSSIMKQRDVELVRQGAPAYLLLIDGLVENSPKDADTLATAANLYSAYNSAFVMDGDPGRAKILSEKAMGYAVAAMSIRNGAFARLHDRPFEQFQEMLPALKKGDVEALFLVISTWASYIQTHRGSWDNVADVAKIEALTRRLLELDEPYYYGSGHLVMGVLCTLLPPALGGRPEEAKKHFERAVEISGGRFLQVYVLFAEHYARAVFDRELYEKLLKTTLQAQDDVDPKIVLINVLAKKQAAKMLLDADTIF